MHLVNRVTACCSTSERQGLAPFKMFRKIQRHLTRLIEKVLDSPKNCSDLCLVILIFLFKKNLLGGAERYLLKDLNGYVGFLQTSSLSST